MPSNSNSTLTTSTDFSRHSGLPTTIISNGPERPIFVGGEWSVGARPGRYFVVWNNDGVLTEQGFFIIPGRMPGTFAVALNLPAGEYVLGAPGTSGGISVYSGMPPKSNSAGEWTIGDPDAVLTKSMIQMAAPHGALMF